MIHPSPDDMQNNPNVPDDDDEGRDPYSDPDTELDWRESAREARDEWRAEHC